MRESFGELLAGWLSFVPKYEKLEAAIEIFIRCTSVNCEIMKPEYELHRYDGPLPQHQPRSSTRWYGSDNPDSTLACQQRQDDWNYEFNSLGFRGQEFDRSAEYSIYFSGCSETFCEGVHLEQSWPDRFADLCRARIKSVSTSYLNMGQSGAPNDYISRVAITQAAALKPSLLIALFSKISRKEHFSDQGLRHIGPWQEDEIALGYYSIYTEEAGLLNTLRNMLLLQSFCQAKGVAWVIGALEADKFANICEHPNKLIATFANLIDWSRYFAFTPHGCGDDCGRDGIHPGVRANQAFAERLFEFVNSIEPPLA